ncbi:MAG: effector binding domain-containing protein [Gammaproteobacteria bacterium]|nr:effector binding domain-containing protein [Gammaproteobacteria bacterium]
MNKAEYYLRLNKAIDFIEANLDKTFSLSSVSKHAFSSLSHFHRIFYFMTGLTIKNYIRRRRLSNAGIQLLTTKRSIIDISFEAQFDSPESFNKAFKKMFHLSPREFRKKRPEFQIMNKLELQYNIHPKQPENILLDFVYLPSQIIGGVKTRTTLENGQQTYDIPIFFEKVIQDKLLLYMPNVIDNKKLFGIYSDMSDEEEFDYTVGLLVENTPAVKEKYVYHILPATEYARFSVQGNARELENAWRYIYGCWMPISGRSRQKGLDFEIYYSDKTDVYIPMISQR